MASPVNNPPNNWGNANNDDDTLGDLLFTADMIIGSHNAGNPVDYQDVSDVLRDIMVHPEIDQRIENDLGTQITIDRLRGIRNGLAGAHHAAVHIGAPAVAPVAPNYTLTNLNNNGRINVAPGTENTIRYEAVENGDQMINFQGERGFGRHYRRANLNQFATNAEGYRLNPATRARIEPGSIRSYTATVKRAEGGKRRKGRKTRKAKKSRKAQRKH